MQLIKKMHTEWQMPSADAPHRRKPKSAKDAYRYLANIALFSKAEQHHQDQYYLDLGYF
jgi:hypothetical protein